MATLKQREVVKKIVENRGMAISAAMREVGYSPETAKNPSNLTESKGWKQLLDEYMPDELLTAVHVEGLQATKILTSHTEPDREVEDYPTRKSYLELAYKVKGKLSADATSQTGPTMNIGTLINNYRDDSTT